jgi:broad specificity phosphatase PhoE
VLEVRRHSYTKKGSERGIGSHLSVEGVRLARRVGESMGPFARVVVSDVPRTLETAIAMGFAVDEVLEFPSSLDWDAVIAEMGWHALWEMDRPFEHIAEVFPSRPHTQALAAHYAAQWLRIAGSAGDGESALVVTHGTVIEATLVACLPEADHASWGPPFSHCEGFRLRTGDGSFTGVEFLRL